MDDRQQPVDAPAEKGLGGGGGGGGCGGGGGGVNGAEIEEGQRTARVCTQSQQTSPFHTSGKTEKDPRDETATTVSARARASASTRPWVCRCMCVCVCVCAGVVERKKMKSERTEGEELENLFASVLTHTHTQVVDLCVCVCVCGYTNTVLEGQSLMVQYNVYCTCIGNDFKTLSLDVYVSTLFRSGTERAPRRASLRRVE